MDRLHCWPALLFGAVLNTERLFAFLVLPATGFSATQSSLASLFYSDFPKQILPMPGSPLLPHVVRRMWPWFQALC